MTIRLDRPGLHGLRVELPTVFQEPAVENKFREVGAICSAYRVPLSRLRFIDRGTCSNRERRKLTDKM